MKISSHGNLSEPWHLWFSPESQAFLSFKTLLRLSTGSLFKRTDYNFQESKFADSSENLEFVKFFIVCPRDTCINPKKYATPRVLVEFHEERAARHPHTMQEWIHLVNFTSIWLNISRINCICRQPNEARTMTCLDPRGSVRRSTRARKSEGPDGDLPPRIEGYFSWLSTFLKFTTTFLNTPPCEGSQSSCFRSWMGLREGNFSAQFLSSLISCRPWAVRVVWRPAVLWTLVLVHCLSPQPRPEHGTWQWFRKYFLMRCIFTLKPWCMQSESADPLRGDPALPWELLLWYEMWLQARQQTTKTLNGPPGCPLGLGRNPIKV